MAEIYPEISYIPECRACSSQGSPRAPVGCFFFQSFLLILLYLLQKRLHNEAVLNCGNPFPRRMPKTGRQTFSLLSSEYCQSAKRLWGKESVLRWIGFVIWAPKTNPSHSIEAVDSDWPGNGICTEMQDSIQQPSHGFTQKVHTV